MGSRTLAVAFALTVLGAPVVHGGIVNPDVFTVSASDAWRYSELENAGIGGSIDYFPTSPAEFALAQFQGFVTYDDDVGGIGWTGTGFDTMQVFETYLLSTTNQSLDLRVGGDDGHSLFVDDVFIDGGGFGATIDYTLSLEAGVARKVTLAGYNGPGNWVFGIGIQGPGDTIENPIDTVPGVQLDAEGDFSATVPEPSTLLLWCGIGGSFLVLRRRRRRAVR